MLTGCASFIAPPYSPHFETLDSLKKQPIDKVAVGQVQPTDPAAPVNRITLRGSSLSSPHGTFAKYLEKALEQDFKELSVYDPAASTRVDATIVKNDIDISGINTGTGVMEVEVKVHRGTEQRLKKTYQATTEFPSSFAGAVAIPKGQAEYGNLVRSLLRKVYEDQAFINALKK
nr:hypothetical protein [Caldimonas mangrovi]